MITPEQIDKWRVVPRLMVFWIAMLVWWVASWFMGLAEPSTQQTTFVSVVTGLIAPTFAFYVNSGKRQ